MIPYKYGTGLERSFDLNTELLKDLGHGVRVITEKAGRMLRRRSKKHNEH